MLNPISNYHDAEVYKIEIDINNGIVSLYVIPYIDKKPHVGKKQILLFKEVKDVRLIDYTIGDMYYIFDIHEEAIKDYKLYTIQFNGPGRLEVQCKELIINELENDIDIPIKRFSHPDTGDTRIKSGEDFF
jgi:hypothetical protein